MNDNEIVVRRGVEAGDRVLLTPPTDRTGIATATIPGLMPTTAPIGGGDTANSMKMPTRSPPPGAASPEKAPVLIAPAPSSKPKG